MNEEQMDLFRTVCFLVLMQHGRGLMMKAPKYIQEKMKVSEDPAHAWSMLNSEGQGKVCDWADKWHFPIAAVLEKLEKEAVSL